jgi:hypothetical protein
MDRSAASSRFRGYIGTSPPANPYRAHRPRNNPRQARMRDAAQEIPGGSQGASWLCSLYGVMEGGVPASSPSNTATGHRRPSVSLPAPLMQRGLDRRRSAPRRPRPGTLDLSINRRGPVIELGLTGDLDMATAPRLGEAMAWLRFSRGPAATIVIDTSDLDFVAAAGYRAQLAALVGPDGRPDPLSPHRGTGRREARARDFGRVDPTSPAERASRLRARLTTAGSSAELQDPSRTPV